MTPKNLFPVALLLALTPVAYAVPDAGGGPPGAAPAVRPAPPPDPARAKKAFTIGYEEYQMASGMETAGASFTGEQAQRTRDAVKAAFTRSRDRFRVAVESDPTRREAWNMLGYTSRKLGDYEESLMAYDKALELSPGYPEATEYRAELFLLTGRLEDVKTAYAELLQSSPSYAGVLKTSMEDWLKAKKSAPGVDDAARKEFAAWVAKLK